MGLEGYLEDLGICDILQIISLSKKSGTLALSGETLEGAITFLQGQVVRAVSSQFPENLGILLCRNQIATKQQILDALEHQRSAAEYRPIGMVLSGLFAIPQAQIESVVTRQIEAIVLNFLTWTRGRFDFQLEEPQAFGSARLNPLDLMLEKGLAPLGLIGKGQGGQNAPLPSVAAAAEQAGELQHGEEQQLDMLRGMLAELENPALSGGIILLILRYASELLNRAIIFDVRGRQLVGLGQFGLDALPGSADAMVRQMRLKIEADSLFGQVVQLQAAVRGPLGDRPDERFVAEILGEQGDEVLVAPLVSDGKVLALLLGDNYPQTGAISSASAFEVFLSQAGMAMEQMLHGKNG